MLGYNVLHPMGWDAFGLPAEQYAIDTGTHPAITTKTNVNRFRQQLKASAGAASHPVIREPAAIPLSENRKAFLSMPQPVSASSSEGTGSG